MKRSYAAVGSAVFFAVAPGTVAGLLPWLITRWHTATALWVVLRVLGWILVAAGAAVIVPAFARFVIEGLGTPMPAAAPSRLVVGGVYRHVRNPMYVAIISAIAGQALAFGSIGLVWYGLLVAAATVTFVLVYEEPTLRHRFGADYETYRRNVPGWWPRLTPWTAPASKPTDGDPNSDQTAMDTPDTTQ
ncbi:MAG TPA: isoprenylcysteine carboxylmethyltransferase family protein [Micromonosporaceae bacterium]|nr:isoprenylcysteine carboxylmethyltransferase family protein [Micromonosporaceae bacterium]